MSDKAEGNITENNNLFNDEEKVTPASTAHKPATELGLEHESEIAPSITEEGEVRIGEAGTEEAMREQAESLESATSEQPQTKPKSKQMQQTLTKIYKSLAHASNQIQRQATQISKINQNLQSMQKQMRAEERQTGRVDQIRSQVIQIQKQISQLHKSVQKGSTTKIQPRKKVSRNKKRNKK
jgi:small-conductance mechanosensitive channel